MSLSDRGSNSFVPFPRCTSPLRILCTGHLMLTQSQWCTCLYHNLYNVPIQFGRCTSQHHSVCRTTRMSFQFRSRTCRLHMPHTDPWRPNQTCLTIFQHHSLCNLFVRSHRCICLQHISCTDQQQSNQFCSTNCQDCKHHCNHCPT